MVKSAGSNHTERRINPQALCAAVAHTSVTEKVLIAYINIYKHTGAWVIVRFVSRISQHDKIPANTVVFNVSESTSHYNNDSVTWSQTTLGDCSVSDSASLCRSLFACGRLCVRTSCQFATRMPMWVWADVVCMSEGDEVNKWDRRVIRRWNLMSVCWRLEGGTLLLF